MKRVHQVIVLFTDIGSDGKEYVIVLPDGGGNVYGAYITSHHATEVNISSPAVSLYSHITLPKEAYPQNVEVVDLDKELILRLPIFSSSQYSKYLLINSSEEISVHLVAFSVDNKDRAGGFLALPSTVLSTEYYVHNFNMKEGTQLLVVLALTKSVVRIHFRTTRGLIFYETKHFENGSTLVLNMNPYTSYQIRSNYNLTGTKITSTRPIAVYSGAGWAWVLNTVAEHVVTQLLPTQLWQTVYIIPPLQGHKYYLMRVLAKETGTTVNHYINERQITKTLNEGEVFEIKINNSSMVVIADKPVSVLQVAISNPAMILIPATNQYRDRYIASKPSPNDVEFTEYVSLIIETAQKDGLRWSGSTEIATMPVPGPCSSYTIVVTQTQSRGAVFWHDTEGVKFGAVAFGITDRAAYGFPLGLRLSESCKFKWAATSGNVPLDMRRAKIQISLRIRAVWSESSQCAFWIVKDAKCHHADNEDSDQTARMRRLIWVLVDQWFKEVRFLTFRLQSFYVMDISPRE